MFNIFAGFIEDRSKHLAEPTPNTNRQLIAKYPKSQIIADTDRKIED